MPRTIFGAKRVQKYNKYIKNEKYRPKFFSFLVSAPPKSSSHRDIVKQ